MVQLRSTLAIGQYLPLWYELIVGCFIARM